jgi:ABC-type multidrug transport system ATPase subunit
VHSVWISIQDFPGAKKFIGIVPQEFNFNLFEKVFDIVANQAGYYGLPPELARERAEKYLRELGLWDKRDNAARECPVRRHEAAPDDCPRPGPRAAAC